MQGRLRCYEAALRPLTKFIKAVEADSFTLPHLPHQVNVLFSDLSPQDDESNNLQRIKEALLDRAKAPVRFGAVLTTSNLALLGAALHPAYSKLPFISSDLRAQVDAWIDPCFPHG
jgi:hypothetical protein